MAILKFFNTIFATGGDTAAIPDATQGDGSVSFTQGYSPDYQADPSTPGVLYPERNKMNYLFETITAALNMWQTHGLCDFISPSDNSGLAYPYDIYALVRYDNGSGVQLYYSQKNNNTDTPLVTTSWAPLLAQSGFQTGDMIFWEDTTLRTGGFVWANGTTVGNAVSNATGRANADTAALFAQTWRVFPQSVRPLVNSSGVVVARGVSAAADYAANRAIPVRDMRDVAPFGFGTMGGTTDRGLLTLSTSQGINGAVFGSTGGEQAHTMTGAELFPHSHTYDHFELTGSPGAAGSSSGFSNVVDTSGMAGSGQPFNVVPPGTICNFIVKL